MPGLNFLYILNLSHFSMYIKLACLITESCFIQMQKESGLAVNQDFAVKQMIKSPPPHLLISQKV